MPPYFTVQLAALLHWFLASGNLLIHPHIILSTSRHALAVALLHWRNSVGSELLFSATRISHRATFLAENITKQIKARLDLDRTRRTQNFRSLNALNQVVLGGIFTHISHFFCLLRLLRNTPAGCVAPRATRLPAPQIRATDDGALVNVLILRPTLWYYRHYSVSGIPVWNTIVWIKTHHRNTYMWYHILSYAWYQSVFFGRTDGQTRK